MVLFEVGRVARLSMTSEGEPANVGFAVTASGWSSHSGDRSRLCHRPGRTILRSTWREAAAQDAAAGASVDQRNSSPVFHIACKMTLARYGDFRLLKATAFGQTQPPALEG